MMGLENLEMHTLTEIAFHQLQLAPRYQDRKRLLAFGFKCHSQSDEDGILTEIFRRIGVKARVFVEIGIETAIECNTAYLLLQGWSGIWIEASKSMADKARTNY